MTGDLRFSVVLQAQHTAEHTEAETLARAVAIATEAEALGFDCVWTTEHHFSGLHKTPSALTMAAFLLGRTSRIGVGTAVTLLLLHSPVHVAEQVALLDVVSGGRFRFGAGRGSPTKAYAAIGPGRAYWEHGLPETLDRVLAALRGPVAGFQEAVISPRPTTRIPVSLAVGSDSTVDIAAARGLSTQQFVRQDLATRAARIERHRRLAPPGEYRHGCWVFTQVEDSQAAAESVLRENLEHGHAYVRRHRRRPELLTSPVPERLATVLANDPVGTPGRCVEQFRRLAATGCTEALCQVEMSLDLDSSITNLRRLAAEVIPAYRRA
ncbi:LLM class flavin-dependent oxidoreductase [Pseudonocardiaceae bacterium YIM PH 21723]|nr:LLM class flavin-dependent oxidoreductase [Pseudonocardiaceae bacterium YIM PH 21723]